MHSLANIQLHFIIGSGRSGTTLLSQALNAHPNIVASPEGKFMLHYWQYLQHRTNIGQADIELFMENAFKIQEHDLADFRIWLINQPNLKKALLDAAPMNFEEFCKTVHLQSYLAREKHTPVLAIVDKNPPYTYFTHEFLQTFLQAKFIALVRDYRDNIASRLKHHLDGNAWQAAHRWRICNTILQSALEQHPNRVLLVRYEDLTANFEQEMRRICMFLNVPFDEQMLHPQAHFSAYFPKLLQFLNLPEGSAHLQDMHSNIGKPVTNSQTKGWQKNLNQQQIQIAEAVCGNLGKVFGYQTTTQTPKNLSFRLNNWLNALRMKLFLIYLVKGYFYLPMKWRLLKLKWSGATSIKDFEDNRQI